ncbi:MAG: 50S ribosomal protein L11 methyltransferase [Desulfuromonas sp.]|nr:MAG: 50S ribosomal protein L11 methyltransferase [Desulfuromonas sp.]
MNEHWIVIEITCPSSAVDLACATLTELGCGGTVVEETQLDTFVAPPPELDPNTVYTLKAYFEQPEDKATLRADIDAALSELTAVNGAWTFELGPTEDVHQKDWAEDWKQNFSTIRIGSHLVIKPSWEDLVPQAGDRVIEIDPGMAFGTGTHSTTLLCLEAIAELQEVERSPRQMLDVGTGSGILALGAAALGCPRIVACDIDETACQVAQQNIAANGYASSIAVTTNPLEQIDGQYDLVVANILAEENVRLADQLVQHLSAGGTLILSGILKEKEDYVRSGFASFPLSDSPTRQHEDWICLVYRKTDGTS